MRHPAMLLYLDNGASVGPNSPAGLRSHRGLNENLARECLGRYRRCLGGAGSAGAAYRLGLRRRQAGRRARYDRPRPSRPWAVAAAGGACRLAWRQQPAGHFEAQDFRECGAGRRLESGWLDRALACLPQRKAGQDNAPALGTGIPLLLRGPAKMGNYAPETAELPHPDLYARILALRAGDALTAQPIADGLKGRDFATATLGGREKPPAGADAFAHYCAAAGRLLAALEGPRIAALELGGCDTHADQMHRLRQPLHQLDTGLVALKQALGPAWADTVVLVATEFGRTVRINGTGGTDHGTGSVAFLLGGRVAGGRVAGTWPGLQQTALFENRDLMPTTDFAAVAKAILTSHLGLTAAQLDTVFPGSGNVQALPGVVKL